MSLFAELKRRNVIRVGLAYTLFAWVLLQAVDFALGVIGSPNWIMQVLVVLAVAGLPAVVVFAWIFEVTPDGIRLESEIDRDQSMTPGTGRKLDRTIIVLLAVAVAFLLTDQYYLDPETISSLPPAPVASDVLPAGEAEPPSIAVIPFENMSGDSVNEPFTTGIHDDLLTQISKIDSIRTISRTSVLRYEGTELSIPEIAAELRVSTILEGGVQRVGDIVRINVQLIDAATDEHIWAETYDRELSAANVFAIQSEIATKIADALKATLTPEDQRRLETVPTNNLAALDAYFRGKQLADTRVEENILEAIEQFDLAIALDSEFALAHAGRAYAWLLIPEYSSTVDRQMTIKHSEESATRALELDPDLPEGLWVMGWNRMAHNYDWAGAEQLLRKALVEHPTNSDALHWLSHVLSWQGRHEEAVRVAEFAVESEPYSPLMKMNLSYIVAEDGQYQRSIDIRDQALALDSVSPEIWRNTFIIQIRAGKFEDATQSLVNWAAGTGRDVIAAERLGQALDAAQQSSQPVELPRDALDTLRIGTMNTGQIYAASGNREMTLQELRIALDERAGSRSVLSMKINPLYDFLRDDPEFQAMQQEVGLAP